MEEMSVRWKTTIIAVLLMATFCGCSIDREENSMNNGLVSKITSIFEKLTEPDDSQLAEEQLKIILTAIKEENSDVILKMFSQNALKEIGDTQSIDQIFSFPASSITSWDRRGGNSSKGINHGVMKKRYTYGYNLHAEDADYVLWIEMHTQDDEDPNDEGLYSIVIYEVGHESPECSGPGIYVAIS